MTSRQKALNLVEELMKSKNFQRIAQLREELNYIFDMKEHRLVNSWLKKEIKAEGNN